MKKFFVTLTLLVVGGLLLAACGGGDSSNNTSNATGANKTASNSGTTASTPATTTNTPASTSTTNTASGEKIGVPECDDYLAKYEACLSSKVPAEARAQWSSALEQTRSSWRQLASNPQTKASLATACKMASDQSRQAMKPYGCDF